LRNVAMTAPYFHDGSAATLGQAVRMMAHHQLGVDLEDDEVREIEAWLGSLTGEIPTQYIAPPVLPTA
jgi:cytochrome c peroxidase